MDDKMLAEAAKRRLHTKPLLTITIAAAGPGKPDKPHPEGCQCEECDGEEEPSNESED